MDSLFFKSVMDGLREFLFLYAILSAGLSVTKTHPKFESFSEWHNFMNY